MEAYISRAEQPGWVTSINVGWSRKVYIGRIFENSCLFPLRTHRMFAPKIWAMNGPLGFVWTHAHQFAWVSETGTNPWMESYFSSSGLLQFS